MKRGRLEVLTIVLVLLLVLVGFSLFDVLNEKLSKKEISGDVVDSINQNNQPSPTETERIYPSNIIDKNGLVYNKIMSSGSINPSARNNVLIGTTPEGTRIFGNGFEDFNGYIVEFKDEPVLVKQKKLKEQAGLKINQPLAPETRTQLTSYKQNLKQKQNNFINSIEQKDAALSASIQSQAPQGIQRKPLKIMNQFTDVFNGLSIDATQDIIEEIKKMPEVKRVVPNYKVNITLMDSVPLINADDVWLLDEDGNQCATSGKECLTGKGVKIGIIDTGVDYTHEDLGGCLGASCKVIGGYDFVNNDDDPMDDHGHGTHVAATAAGNGVLKGVAPDANIYGYKVLNSGGSGYYSWIIGGIERSIDPNQDGDYSDHLDVISLSLGGPGDPDDPMSQAIDNAVDNGVIAVIAAGNSGPGEQTIGSPGTARKAITVGATDKNDQIASFSSRGPVIWTDANGQEQILVKPDIVAPGVNICAAQWDSAWSDRKCLDDKHISISGTSMATPHVSGAVALLLQKHPDWNPEEIKYALRNTAIDIGENVLTQGHGRIDVLSAIQLNSKPSIAKLNTIQTQITGEIISDNFDHYELSYSLIGSNQWIQISIGSSIPSDGVFGNVDLNLLPDGKYIYRLEAYNKDGLKSSDYQYLNLEKIKILSPMENRMFNNKDPMDIRLGIKDGLLIDSYDIKYGVGNSPTIWKSDGITLIRNGDLYGTWLPTSAVFEGGYTLKITMKHNGIVEDKRVSVYVDPLLKKGWPVSLSYCQFFSTYISCVGDAFGGFTPTTADVNNDGFKEIAIKGVWKVHLYDYGGKSISGWPVFRGGYVYSTGSVPPVSIGDIDNDFELEIVSGSAQYSEGTNWGEGYLDNCAYAFENDGTLSKGWPVKCSIYDNQGSWGLGESTVVLADLKRDNNLETIGYNIGPTPITSNDWGYLYAFNSDGNTIEGWPVLRNFKYGGFGRSDPVLGDVDNDGDLDVVIVTTDIDGNSYITILDEYGSTENQFKIVSKEGYNIYGGLIFSSPILFDVDNDGDLEIAILIGAYGLFVFDHTGSLRFSFDSTPSPYSLVIGDINNDNSPDLFFISRINGMAGQLMAVNKDGNLLDGWPTLIEPTRYEYGYELGIQPTIGDINDDGFPDILFSNFDSNVYGVDYTGKFIFSKNLPSPFIWASMSGILLDDIDKDGKTDMVMVSVLGDIYVWNLDSTYDPSTMEWPMFQHDPQHTGCYDCDKLRDPNKVYIKNQGQNVAWFGDRGNIVLKGPCQVKPTCTPPADSFIFKNSAGDTVAYIDINGNLCIETGDCLSSTSCSVTSNDEFIMQDETEKVVSKIDLTNGDLCYTGKLIENGNP